MAGVLLSTHPGFTPQKRAFLQQSLVLDEPRNADRRVKGDGWTCVPIGVVFQNQHNHLEYIPLRNTSLPHVIIILSVISPGLMF